MVSFQPEPTWSGERPARGRILIEAAEWRDREALRSVFSAEGFQTSTCPGPEGALGRCPLAAGEGCRATREADVVVHALRASDVRNLEVLRAIRRSDPDKPVIVEVPDPTKARDPVTYEGTITVAPPAGRAALTDALKSALRSGSSRSQDPEDR